MQLYCSGLSLREVGDELGVSRERIRQYLVDANVHTRHNGWRGRPCAIAVMKAIRAPGVLSFTQAAARSPDLTATTISNAARALGCGEAVRRLFRLRSRARLREDLAQVAAVIGRTPTATDMNAHVGGLYGATSYQRVFGSVRDAQTAAGLKLVRQRRVTSASI
jgi:hypothetical protein